MRTPRQPSPPTTISGHLTARFQDWSPLFILLCVPAMMGMDGGELLPAIYVVTNALGGWLGARNGVRSMREDFTKHVNDDTVHVTPPK